MELEGEIFSGTSRGREYINLFFERIQGTIDIKPYLGTLNVRLRKNINLRPYETKTIGHVIRTGHKEIELGFVPAMIEDVDCWIITPRGKVYPDNEIEIISELNLREKLNLKDGSVVKIKLTGKRRLI